ncbi:hypothetical protein DP939_01280 [Spongiactinospora rosea]|uniref:Uncharacterized protein n=1 Tax=Spongiactinospora rosea TaxID=2248750 RepID=A0A366M541_9ACTN|nr:hypothetical protein [Spongiactinospora rosea]RBQ21378.1 hypothetical protein DP939_01280 [Spongiactinospora rosea]
MRSRAGLVLAAAGCVPAVALTVWWLVGDLSADVPPGAPLDHSVRPPDLAPWAETAIGAGALVVAAGTLAVLVRASARRGFDRRWWATLVPLLAAAALTGFGWRVVTAGSVGANVGAGLVVIVGGPVVALLVLWSAGWSIRLLLARRVV